MNTHNNPITQTHVSLVCSMELPMAVADGGGWSKGKMAFAGGTGCPHVNSTHMERSCCGAAVFERERERKIALQNATTTTKAARSP